MMLLYVENSDIPEPEKEHIRAGICLQLSQTWQGKRADSAFVKSLHNFDNDLIGKLDAADRLAHLMTTASGIAGNPRLIKRFLNALSIRMAISKAHGVGVDETVLAKMLLFERVGNAKAYSELTTAVNSSPNGRPFDFLAEWEEKANAGQDLTLQAPWNEDFVKEWLRLPPRLAELDLRGVLYVSREHAPLISPQDRLSSEAADLLTALLTHPDMAAGLKEKLSKVSRTEKPVMMDRLLEHARQEQEWGVPPIFEACLAVAEADPPQGLRLAAFLSALPGAQIRPGIVPKIFDQTWAHEVFAKWEKTTGVSNQVKKAIEQRRNDGNVRVK